ECGARPSLARSCLGNSSGPWLVAVDDELRRKNFMRNILRSLPLLLLLPLAAAHAEEFEDLGMPIRTTRVNIQAVTTGENGTARAWGVVSGEKVRQLLGFDIATGKKTV